MKRDADDPQRPPLRVIPGNPARADQRARETELEKRFTEERKQKILDEYRSMISGILEKPLRMVTTGQFFCFGTCPEGGPHWCHEIIVSEGRFTNCSRQAAQSLYCNQHRKNRGTSD